jgi:uncharacterized protein
MKKTLVIGASVNPNRYSNMAICKLLANNVEVVAIGRREGVIDGVNVYATKKIFKDVDTVTLYVSAKNQQEFYNYILALNPKRVIFNPGTENLAFEKILTEKNIEFENACTLVLLGIGAY